MKRALIIGSLAAVVGAGSARGAVILVTETENLAIPVGNPVGINPAGIVTTVPINNYITSLTVGLNVSGGYNGNLSAYLEAPNGATVSLLNLPGVTGTSPFGYGGSGLSVSFSDAASSSLQTTPETPGAVVMGTYQAIGSLSTFKGLTGNGTWNLFIADDVAGGGQPVLSSWSLNMTVIPEATPVWGIALVLAAALGVEAMRCRARARLQK